MSKEKVYVVRRGTNLFEPLTIEREPLMPSADIEKHIYNEALRFLSNDKRLQYDNLVDPKVMKYSLIRTAHCDGNNIIVDEGRPHTLWLEVNIGKGDCLTYSRKMTNEEYERALALMWEGA